MGSGYNTSLAAGRSARNKAATRTPVHFYLDVPYYVYELPCKDTLTGEPHTFRSRTPATSQGGMYHFWCTRCREYREVRAITHQPVNRPHSKPGDGPDEVVGLEQDKGILRERIAKALQGRGFLETDEQIASAAVEFGVPVAEIKRINAGLVAPEGLSGLPDMCQAGLHEMTTDNTATESSGRRTCRACRLTATRERVARHREAKAKARSGPAQKAA